MSNRSSLSAIKSNPLVAVNAIIASRVSTERQDDNDTPLVQLARTRRYAQEKGYHIAGELQEVVSGAAIAARSKLKDVFELARQGIIQIVVFDKPDRIGRGDAQTILEYEAREAGLRVEYATPGADTSTPTGKMVRAVERVMSESERHLFAERSIKGKREKILRGQIVLPSTIPYGYKAVRKFDDMGKRISAELAVDEEKIVIYHRARRMLVEERISLSKIVKTFNTEGIPAPRGGRWTRSSLRKILINRVYAGEYRHGQNEIQRVDTEQGVRYRRIGVKADYVKIAVPAVITEAEYAEIRTVLEDNKNRFESPRKYQYLLSGMIRCAKCGLACVGAPKAPGGKIYLYYKCRRSRQGLCDAREMPPRFTEKVWEIVTKLLTEPESVASGQEENRRRISDSSAIEAEIRAQERAIESAKAEMESAIRLQARAGVLSDETAAAFTTALLQIQQRIDSYRAILESIRKRKAEIEAARESKVEIKKLREEQAEKLSGDMTFETKQQILRRIRLSCVWDSDKRTLTLSSLVGSAEINED